MSRRNPQVSIIIPALNEEHTISSVLRSLARQDRISDCEVIVVDGESRDGTIEAAEGFPFVRVETSTPGRALQMNRGADVAQAPILWFLHADSILPDRRTVDALLEVMEDRRVVGGYFRYHLRGDDLYYRLMTALVNLRARLLARPYGDQGFFVSRDTFQGLSGFRSLPAGCEDLDFILRLREQGEVHMLPQTVETSARTWKRYGKIATTAWHLNQWLRYELARKRQLREAPKPEEPGEPSDEVDRRTAPDTP